MVKPLLAQSKLPLASIFAQSMSDLQLGAVELIIEHLHLPLPHSFALEPLHDGLVLLLAGFVEEEILLADGRLALGSQGGTRCLRGMAGREGGDEVLGGFFEEDFAHF